MKKVLILASIIILLISVMACGGSSETEEIEVVSPPQLVVPTIELISDVYPSAVLVDIKNNEKVKWDIQFVGKRVEVKGRLSSMSIFSDELYNVALHDDPSMDNHKGVKEEVECLISKIATNQEDLIKMSELPIGTQIVVRGEITDFGSWDVVIKPCEIVFE